MKTDIACRAPRRKTLAHAARIVAWTFVLWLTAWPAAGQWTHQSHINTEVSAATDHAYQPQIVAGPNGGTFVLWSSVWAGSDVYLQWITSSGHRQATDAHVASSASQPVMAADGNGGVIVTWKDVPSGRLRAQRYDTGLNPQWSLPASVASAGLHEDPAIIADGSGGAVISWTHRADGASLPDIHAQRLDSAGVPLWNSTHGFSVVAHSARQERSALAPGADGGDAIVVWEDTRSSGGTGRNIWGRYIDPSGGGSGVEQPIADAIKAQTRPQIVADGSGGAVVAWIDGRDNKESLFAQRVNEQLNRLWSPWSGVKVATTVGNTEDHDGFELGPDGSGGAVIAWTNRSLQDHADLYFQRLDAAGAKDWGGSGLPLTSGSSNNLQRVEPALAADGAGGAVVAWSHLAQVPDGVGDIFAQYVEAWPAGTAWQAGGLLISDAPDHQTSPDVVAGAGGCPAKITWEDYRDDGDVYIQRVKCPGTLGRFAGFAVAVDPGWIPAPHDTPIGIGVGTPWDDLAVLEDSVFELAYDPEILHVLDVVPGTLEGIDAEIDAEAGLVRVHVTSAGAAASDEDLFTLWVQGVAPGSSSLAVTRADAGPDHAIVGLPAVITVDEER